ncbi:coiled-coil domain-containing protein 170-like [Babylonia areolata]|uniref:coiled-coil domain-containing protein 170-like n=1 Tax=Babylonia areolata TaxID=304850 RepID=UPI003FD193C5
MSYIRPLETDSLPLLNESASARRIRALEEELAAYRRGNTPRFGYLKYSEYENGGGSITRRAVTELQEQVKVFREELRKKDAMIQHLVSLESAPKVQHSTEKFDILYQGDKEALERARSDVAALQVRNEHITQQLKECEGQVEEKEVKVKELETLLETKRENEARFTELIQSLRERISELEGQVGSYETVSNRGEYTISTLQKDLRESNDKVVGLEARLREMKDEQDSWKLKLEQADRKFIDLASQLSALLHVSEETWDASVSVEIVVKKVTDLTEENALLKGKLVMLNETLTSTQLEGKASRETIMRLVSEMGREQKLTIQYNADMEKLRAEREEAQMARTELEREVQLLKERLEGSEKLHDATKSELVLRESRLNALEQEIRQSSHSVHSTSAAFESHRRQLVEVLRTVFEEVDGSDQGLMEAVRKLTLDIREYRLKAEDHEGRVNSLTEQLNKQADELKELALHAKRYQTDARDLDNKLRTAEGELAAGDVLREGFKSDKEKYLQGLQRLAEIMKMDQASLDVGLDMALEALVSRAQQLVSLEADTLAERTTQMYSLKRRVKSLKDQLESKELHIDLLRKKLTALEERVHGRVEMQKLAEAESLQVKKLEALVARYKVKLTDARQEIQNLKAQLLGTTQLKLHTLEQRKEVEDLASQVEELEDVRRQQAGKLSVLREEAASTESDLKEKLLVADNAVQALSSELRTTKNALGDVRCKEKQLLDFRGVVSRMLGLDLHSLAVPDYEIISRLEKLIQAHHTSAFTAIGLQEALADAEDGLVSDLDIVDPVVRQSRLRCRRRAARVRARTRSLSPV